MASVSPLSLSRLRSPGQEDRQTAGLESGLAGFTAPVLSLLWTSLVAVGEGISTAEWAKVSYNIPSSRSIPLSLGRSSSPSGLGRHFVSPSPLHFQPAQHAYPAVMWPNRRQPLSRTCKQYSLRFWLASSVVPVTSTASCSCRRGLLCTLLR